MKLLNLTSGRLVRFVFCLALIFQCLPSWAIDITWEGTTHRDVKIVAVEEDEVTLESKKGEKFTMPREKLSGLLVTEAKQVEEAQKKNRTNEVAKRPKSQDMFERAWIHGSASNISDEGFQVYSTSRSLKAKGVTRSGKVKEPKDTKSGAQIYNGVVFVKGLRTIDNSKFDRVLWRDGWITSGGKRLPVFSPTQPRVRLPKLTEEREWADVKGRKMTAMLKEVKDGKGLFVPPKGKPFVYAITSLGADDQIFVKEALEKYDKAVEQLQKDYPWLKLKK